MLNFPHSRKELQQFLTINGLPLLKVFGQNFLVEEKVHQDIINAAELQSCDHVLEIGCGIGHLTQHLAPNVANFWGVEIDERFYPILHQYFDQYSSFHLLQCDILSTKHTINPIVWDTILPVISQQPYKLIANLPYNVSAPVLVNFLESEFPPATMIVTIQKEVAQRLLAKPGTEFYGPLTILAQVHADITLVRNISPQSFVPPPKVYSSVVKFVTHPISNHIMNLEHFKNVVRSVFNMKRKTVANALKNSPFLSLEADHIASALENASISATTRGETLSLEQLITLSNQLLFHSPALG